MTRKEVKEKPILFSAEMVRAILAGRKSMTRRVIVPQPGPNSFQPDGDLYPCMREAILWDGKFYQGERLWVKENYRLPRNFDRKPPSYVADDHAWMPLKYEADGRSNNPHLVDDYGGWGKLRPNIFMPRWVSRITLEITGVKIERLMDISEEDAKAEGIWQTDNGTYRAGNGFPCRVVAKDAFEDLWQSINGKDSWAANPWVWAISFRQLAKSLPHCPGCTDPRSEGTHCEGTVEHPKAGAE